MIREKLKLTREIRRGLAMSSPSTESFPRFSGGMAVGANRGGRDPKYEIHHA